LNFIIQSCRYFCSSITFIRNHRKALNIVTWVWNPARPEILQPLPEWSNWRRSESSTPEKDVCLWRYTLIVALATKEDCQKQAKPMANTCNDTINVPLKSIGKKTPADTARLDTGPVNTLRGIKQQKCKLLTSLHNRSCF